MDVSPSLARIKVRLLVSVYLEAHYLHASLSNLILLPATEVRSGYLIVTLSVQDFLDHKSPQVPPRVIHHWTYPIATTRLRTCPS